MTFHENTFEGWIKSATVKTEILPTCTNDLMKQFNKIHWGKMVTRKTFFGFERSQSLYDYVNTMKTTNKEKYIAICSASNEDGLKQAIGKHRYGFFGKTRGLQFFEEVIDQSMQATRLAEPL
ncbi:MAG: hypothetical protein H0U75_05565 [Legionella sp.]|nr:hypothetical protein [Legionella sp.]